MAYVPNLPSQNTQNALASAPAPQQAPSKANLMMAMAEMHKQGRFAKAAPVTQRTLKTNSTLKKNPTLPTQR
jgi:hypothetical protein